MTIRDLRLDYAWRAFRAGKGEALLDSRTGLLIGSSGVPRGAPTLARWRLSGGKPQASDVRLPLVILARACELDEDALEQRRIKNRVPPCCSLAPGLRSSLMAQ